MVKRYRVPLTAAERDELAALMSRGRSDARTLTHARVVLQADASEAGPGWVDAAIAEALRISVRTVERVRQRFIEDGLFLACEPLAGCSAAAPIGRASCATCSMAAIATPNGCAGHEPAQHALAGQPLRGVRACGDQALGSLYPSVQT